MQPLWERWARVARSALRFGLPLLFCAAVPALHAQVLQVQGTLTSLTGNEKRMISYRNQSHMWRTSDGYTHLLMNKASGLGSPLLVVETTLDGVQWTQSASLPSPAITSTSDVDNEGDEAYVVYSGAPDDSLTGSHGVRFVQLHYDSSQHTWSVVKSELVFSDSSTFVSTPATIADQVGRRWVSVTTTDGTTYSIKMFVKESDTGSWQDTGQVFAQDTVPNAAANTPDRSARPVLTRTGVGLIYTLHKQIYWTQRVNRWPLDHAWTHSRLVYERQGDDSDPYETHYSVVVDSNYNIHLVSVDGGRMVYSRMLNAAQAWTTKSMSNDSGQSPQTAYVQAVVVGSKLVVIANAGRKLELYASSNFGSSFVHTHELSHDTAAVPSGVDPTLADYDNPRVEVASNAVSPLIVLQQVHQAPDDPEIDEQWALSFAVPVDP